MTPRQRSARTPPQTPDMDQVRSVLQRVANGVGVSRQEARSALATLNRMSPPLAPVLTAHAWCQCDHQHDTMRDTGRPALLCVWVFCTCPGFRPRSLAPPTSEEQAELAARLARVLATRDAERAGTKRGE